MRNLVYAATALSLVGCLSQSAFEEKYAEKFCAEWAECNTAGTECPTGGTGTGTGEEAECDYDSGAAKDCLNEEWTCNDDFPGFEFPVPPSACANVCGDGGGGETDMTDMTDM